MVDQTLRDIAFYREGLPETLWPVLSCIGPKELQVAGSLKATGLSVSQSGGQFSSMATFTSQNPEPPYVNWNHHRSGGNPLRYGYIQIGDFGDRREFRFVTENGANFGFYNGNLTLSISGGANPIGAMSIDVGTFGTGPNSVNSYYFRVRDIGAGSSTPFYIRGDGKTFGDFVQTSSREFKENIALLSPQEATRTLAELQPVTFQYKSDRNRRENIGFIAEDVPEAIATADHQGLSIMNIVGVLTKVVQEQQNTIANLTEQVKALESLISQSLVNKGDN